MSREQREDVLRPFRFDRTSVPIEEAESPHRSIERADTIERAVRAIATATALDLQRDPLESTKHVYTIQ
jgi:hypothetical protein